MTFSRQATLVAAALLLATACSQGPDGDGSAGRAAPAAATAGPSEPQGPPPTVEELAAEAGCEPKIQVDADDLRTGFCQTAGVGRFFLTTFTTQQGKDEWMDLAPEYAPHLVGNLWTALADRAVLDRLRARIGGDLHLKDHRVTPSPMTH